MMSYKHALCGQVISVQSKSGPRLAVVLACVKPGGFGMNTSGLIVIAEQESCWVSEASIISKEPQCPICSGHRWWWVEEADFIPDKIQCAACEPPTPDWEMEWGKLDASLSRLPANDSNRLRDEVHLADEAFEKGDCLAFGLRFGVYLETGSSQ